MDSVLNVTVDSLATHVGIIDNGQGNQPDLARSRMLKAQVSNVGFNTEIFHLQLFWHQ